MRFSGTKRTVIDGPFTETKELIAGFWLWQVKSMDEAIEWVKRCPVPMTGEVEIEIRQVFEAEDFGAEFTPELREQEERLRAKSGMATKAEAAEPRPAAQTTYRNVYTREIAMQIQPYLFFEGRCREAFEFYKRVARRRSDDAHALQRSARQPPPGMMPAGLRAEDHAARASRSATATVHGAPTAMARGKPNFEGISLVADRASDDAEAERLFDAARATAAR